MFALGAKTLQSEKSQKMLAVGEGLAKTCHESYARTGNDAIT